MIANLSVLGSPIYPGGQVEVIVSAHSPTDETLSYSWTIPDGWQGSDEDNAMIILTAPDEQAARGTVGVAVSDGKYTRSAEVVLATRGLAIESWDLSLSADEPLGLGDDLSVRVVAYNPEGYPLRYSHTLSGMVFSEGGPDANWTVTQRSMGGLYRVSTTVSDDLGYSAVSGADVQMEGVSVWPGFGGDRQRTGRSPSPGAQGAVGNEIWSFKTYHAVQFSPAVGADGTVYVGSGDGHVYALDPANGNELWSFETGNWVESSPALGADGTVYVGSGDGHVYAIR